MGRSSNLFKFVSFSERISKLRIDVVHRIEKHSETPEDSDTFFQQSLAKWLELNCSLDFQAFYKEIKGLVKSLSLLVYHQKAVVEILQRYLKKKDTLALDALLELCVELSRDLQGDFSVYFTEFLKIIAAHLDTKDAQKIEDCFKTLAYLFKFQWRYLIKDMKSLFRSYSPLLNANQAGHIHRFAAESFAFLVRKSKNLPDLFNYILLHVLKTPHVIPGVGMLFAETVRGVQNQFHSCTENVVTVLLGKLAPDAQFDENLEQGQKILEVFTTMFNEMAKYTKKEHSQVIWNCLYQAIDSLLKEKNVDGGFVSDKLTFLAQLTGIWTDWKQGSLIFNAAQLQKCVCSLIRRKPTTPSLKTAVLNLAVSLLLNTELEDDRETKVLKSVFTSKQFQLADICRFCRNLKQWSAFADTVRPKLMSYFEDKMLSARLKAEDRSDVLFMLAEMVVDSVSFEEGYCGSTVEEITPFDFPKMLAEGGAKLWEVLFRFECEKFSECEVETTWAALVALPFCRPLDVNAVLESLGKLFSLLSEKAKSSSDVTRLLFILSQTVKCVSLLCKFHEKSLEETLPFDTILGVLRDHSRDVHVLQACHVYFSVVKEQTSQSVSSNELLLQVYECVEKNLASHARLVRLLTLKILTTFSEQLDSEYAVFDDCLQAELVPLTFQEYRRKLILLQKLSFANTRDIPDVIREAPLRYLMGMLYLNLSTMWDPIMTLITTYAVEENKMTFWRVFHEYLAQDPADSVESEIASNDPNNTSSSETLNMFFQRQLALCSGAREDNRVDRHNFRLLLWKTMAKFPQIVEPRSRQLVPLFLDFVRKECSVIDEAGRVSYQDLTRGEDTTDDVDMDPTDTEQETMEVDHGQTETDHEPIETDLEPTDTDHEPTISDNELTESDHGLTSVTHDTVDSEDESNQTDQVPNVCDDGPKVKSVRKRRHSVSRQEEVGQTKVRTTRPVRMKTLSACLTLFGLFKNPKKLYQEKDMRQVYLTLLTQKDGDIQKLAVACLMTYKFDYLLPYKENLDRLMEDKTFRDELTSFSADEELNVVIPEHREEFIYILIRILYGKMQRWTGTGTRGKAGSGARRSLVLRFLNSCHGDEMRVFIDLITYSFKEIHDDEELRSVTILSQVVPLRKQLGYLNMFSQLIEVLGTRASQYLPRLLEILFYCLGTCKDSLEQREKVDPRFLSNLRADRQLGIRCLTKFFEKFPHYDFSSIMDKVLKLAVCPQIAKLRFESLQSPTALLRLLNTWTKNPRLHPLLSHVPAGTGEGLLSHVFACLTSDHVCTPVVTMVMEMTERLLSSGGDEQLAHDGENHTHSVNYEESFEERSPNEPVPYGTGLVLPHVAVILDHLSKSVKRTARDLSKAKGKLSKISPVSNVELSVLSKISPYIVDSENSLVLVRLMLPILIASRKEEAQIGLLRSIKNLLQNVQDPMVFFEQFSRLFSSLQSRDARLELCDVFSSMDRKTAALTEHAQLLHGLNSWNKKQLDEPDFETRLNSFSKAGKLVQTEAKAEFVVPLLLNATYTAMNTGDLALRYSAMGFVRTVVDVLRKREKADPGNWFDVLVVGCLIPAVREAVKSKQEGARNEFILVLGNLVKTFDHPLLNELKPLTSEDAEVDFFENIVHIQVHRRVRALRKFASACAETTFSSRTLSSFILPLVTHFVYEYRAVKDHNVVTEAIHAIAAIATQLTWPKYSTLLRHYLRLLPREKEIQKIVVRIVVCILESFHFDLTSLQEKNIEGHLESKDAKTMPVEGDRDTQEDVEDNDEDEGDNVDKSRNDGEYPMELKLKIHATITTKILPHLHKCLTKKVESSDFHRLSGRKEDDQEEILRVPIILAMVKLLQSLPTQTLEANLPGLIVRVCQALKSRAFDVRETARDTLSKITNSLGVYFFPFILNELRSSLIKGYQLHVLGSTLYFILNKFEDSIPDGGLDGSIKSIVEVLVEDAFGEPAREREVEKIATKLPEARNSKTFESFELVAKKISAAHLVAIITPLKEVLDETQNHKVSLRVQEVLRRVSIGLQKNAVFPPEQMLVFVHGLVCERLPLLQRNDRGDKKEKNAQDPRLQPSDTYIIPSQPSRGGKAPEVGHKTNAHVLITFGLQLLLTALKRQKLVTTDERHAQMLDPFVVILTDALNSKHVKITTIALRCLCWLVKFPLPSLKTHVLEIASRLFKLLKLHSRTGGAAGDNHEMVISAFKTITILIRDFTQLKVTERQLRILLTFVEEDIHDYSRQSSAFPLLKAIVSRNLQVSEINDVMLKVAELSVTDQSSSVRLQCRQVLLQYLLDYPLGKKLKRYLEFFVSQLEYEDASGRESTLEMLVSIVKSFPEKVIFVNAGLFFLPLCTRLVNDESVNCRKLTAVAIKSLLEKLDVERRDNLYAILLTWMSEDKLSLQRLAFHVTGLFVEVEGHSFDRRLDDLLPSLFEILKPENYQEKGHGGVDMVVVRQQETIRDHLLINALMTLTKILQETEKGKDRMTAEAWDSILSHLAFPHAWVRLMASRLYGLLFSLHNPEELIELSKEGNPDEYLAVEITRKIAGLCEAFLEQLKTQNLGEELSEQIVKNLFYLSKLMVLINKAPSGSGDSDHVTISFLLTKMCNIAKYESSQTPKLTQKRVSVLRWIAAVGSYLGDEDVRPFLAEMLKPVYRELDGGSTCADEKLRELAQEVAELFKKLVGHEVFAQAYSTAKQSASEARAKRKMQSAFEMVANPEASVAKKLKRNLAKKESRKRKLDTKKPSRKLKRMKTSEIT